MKRITYFTRQLMIMTALTCCFMMFQPTESKAQRHSVENVSFRVLEDNIIVVNYDLMSQRSRRRFNVNLSLHQSSNPAFKYEPRTALGDVGKKLRRGENKQIIWSMNHELPDDFTPTPLINDYYFKVEARRKSRFGRFFFAAVLGGAAYYFLVEEPLF